MTRRSRLGETRTLKIRANFFVNLTGTHTQTHTECANLQNLRIFVKYPQLRTVYSF